MYIVPYFFLLSSIKCISYYCVLWIIKWYLYFVLGY